MALRLDKVTVHYGEHIAATNVSMSVKENGLHGLFGPNGSGKSSVIKAVCGLEKYTGSIEILGKEARKHSVRQLSCCLAYVPQTHGFVYGYNVLEVVMMGDARYRLSLPDTSLRSAARDVLEQLGARDLECRRVTELSGGERQLVQMARVLNQNTPLLILDEPFAHLDFGNQIFLWKKLRNMASKKIILIASHDPNYIMWFCDSVFIMKKGKIIAQRESIYLQDMESLYPGQWRKGILGNSREFIAPDI